MIWTSLYRRGIVILCFFCSTCFSEPISLSQEEFAVLRGFFQILIEESEVGYVLEGSKPVCIHGFFKNDPFSVDTVPHRHSVALREGARIWERLSIDNPEIVLKMANQEDLLIPNWIHVMAIHCTLFRDVVAKNLSLFQYVLGPAVNPENLLSAIRSDKITYHSLLKGDKVLVGEILGFGTQNALYISRIENIEEALDQDNPPFLNIEEIVREYPDEYLPFEPGFGFDSVLDELETLQQKVTLPSQKLMTSKPEFVFGCLKNFEENRKFIFKLEETQNKIQRQLKTETLLQSTLSKFTGHQYVAPTQPESFLFDLNQVELNIAVAKGIWESLQEYDQECLSSFISGLDDESLNTSVIDHSAYMPKFRQDFIEAKNNLIESNNRFSSLNQEEGLNCVIPNKLYYKTLVYGRDQTNCRGPLVSLEYSIFSPSGQCIAHESNRKVNLKNTIPGFSLGVKGMKIGETREIFIHPSLGYGFDTSIDRCITLRAVVTLKEIHDNQSYSQSIDYLDLDFVLDEDILKERTEKYKSALSRKGNQIVNHLKKCSKIDLQHIRDSLRAFQNGTEKFIPTTEKERTLINQMNWNIYFGRS